MIVKYNCLCNKIVSTSAKKRTISRHFCSSSSSLSLSLFLYLHFSITISFLRSSFFLLLSILWTPLSRDREAKVEEITDRYSRVLRVVRTKQNKIPEAFRFSICRVFAGSERIDQRLRIGVRGKSESRNGCLARRPAGFLISHANCPDVPRNRKEISVIISRTEAAAAPLTFRSASLQFRV